MPALRPRNPARARNIGPSGRLMASARSAKASSSIITYATDRMRHSKCSVYPCLPGVAHLRRMHWIHEERYHRSLPNVVRGKLACRFVENRVTPGTVRQAGDRVGAGAVVHHTVVCLLVAPTLHGAHRSVWLEQSVDTSDVITALSDEVQRRESALLVGPIEPVQAVVEE